MQRLFSTFADGWPGGGLLLLRLLAGGVLLYCESGYASSGHHFAALAPRIIGACGGMLLLAGLWTPLAGALVAAVELWSAFSRPGFPLIPVILSVVAASLAMIGPGAWSVDARLFGRKHIDPPEL